MLLRLKTKLTLGLAFLFAVTLLISMQGVYQIYQLNDSARLILRQNLHSIVFSNNMLQALEAQPVNLAMLNENIRLQQQNITEPGEGGATAKAVHLVGRLQKDTSNQRLENELKQTVLQIAAINQQAIIRKNDMASAAASRAILTLSITTLILLSISIIFVMSYPVLVTRPINMLATGIKEIAARKYHTRVHLPAGDEFGELSAIFNDMAERLHEYETTNLEQIRIEKRRLEAIINQMNDAIIGFDEKKHLLFMNAVAKSWCRDPKSLASIFKHPLHQQLKLHNGQKTVIYIKEVAKLSNKEDSIGEVIVLRDISAFYELENAKTKFIATASHELKTPISSMQMSLRLLTDTRTGPLAASQQELLASMEEDVERILAISTQLLDATQEAVKTPS